MSNRSCVPKPPTPERPRRRAVRARRVLGGICRPKQGSFRCWGLGIWGRGRRQRHSRLGFPLFSRPCEQRDALSRGAPGDIGPTGGCLGRCLAALRLPCTERAVIERESMDDEAHARSACVESPLIEKAADGGVSIALPRPIQSVRRSATKGVKSRTHHVQLFLAETSQRALLPCVPRPHVCQELLFRRIGDSRR